MKCPHCQTHELGTADIEGICQFCKNKQSQYPQGWQCPRCGLVYASWESECSACNSQTTVGATNEKYKGTQSTHVGNISINCMSSEARDLQDTILEKWKEFHPEDTGDHYRFVYWLVRYSDLIEPKREPQ